MSIETPEAPVAEKPKRVKRSPADLKAARVEKARKTLERLRESGEKILTRAETKRKAAEDAQAKADAYADEVALAEANLAWEQSRPVRGEVHSGTADEPFADDEDDFDDTDEDVDPDAEPDDL